MTSGINRTRALEVEHLLAQGRPNPERVLERLPLAEAAMAISKRNARAATAILANPESELHQPLVSEIEELQGELRAHGLHAISAKKLICECDGVGHVQVQPVLDEARKNALSLQAKEVAERSTGREPRL